MNAYIHAEISVKKRGGSIEDYYPIHDFMDCTKEICSDNRHRILHTMWGIKRVILPIFGHTLINSSGKHVNIKDLCEQDHILPDYRNRFIPTLKDFTDAIEPCETDAAMINTFLTDYKDDVQLCELLLSPLSNTGNIKSLFFTHNSWFINDMVPKILQRKPLLKEFTIAPSYFFNRMKFERWMDNGNAIPQSALKTQEIFYNSIQDNIQK